MHYVSELNIGTMKNLDLFDNIHYKYLKNVIYDDEYYIDVEIEDLPYDRIAWCKTRFTFKLNIDVSDGALVPNMEYKEFKVNKEYNGSSIYALMMLELQEEEEEEEEENDDKKDKDEDEE